MKKCPRCKVFKEKPDRNITYCKPCLMEVNENKRNKAHEKIMKATNNGKAWWVLQSINADRHYRKEE